MPKMEDKGWIRHRLPTEEDSDDMGDILLLRENGRKWIYKWDRYIEDDVALPWLPIPKDPKRRGIHKEKEVLHEEDQGVRGAQEEEEKKEEV
jgi:hypothetical protein